MYLFSHITDLLKSLKITSYYNQWQYQIKTRYPSLYADILTQTEYLNEATFTERLYCYTNKITHTPSCRCGKDVSFNIRRKRYHDYCSQGCSLKDVKNLLGVENVSQLPEVKAKKKQLALEKYGVDNVSKAPIVIDTIKAKASARWEEYFSIATAFPLSKQQYYQTVNRLTAQTYTKYKDVLDPDSKRGIDWHLDHRYSISEGYRNNVAPEIISSLHNLEMLDAHTNSWVKNKKCSIRLEDLIAAFNELS